MKTATRKSKFYYWRKKMGLRCEDIAVKTGINSSTLFKWDRLGHSPLNIYRKMLAEHYPDCPLAQK